MKYRNAVAFLACSLAAAACGLRRAPPPGFSGPVPSPAAQRRLNEAQGGQLRLSSGPLAGAPWTVGEFAVVPNEASPGGKGPVVLLWRGGAAFRDAAEVRSLPVETDADVEDLVGRVLGANPIAHEAPRPEPGGTYRRFVPE